MSSECLKELDIRFKNPCSFILAGHTMLEQRTFTFNLLRHIETLFHNPQCKQNVIYFSQSGLGAFVQEKYPNSDQNIVRKWVNRLPSASDIEEMTLPYREGGSVIIVEDFFNEISKDFNAIFTWLYHRTNSVVILLTQETQDDTCQNKALKELFLNATYAVFFKNQGDNSQIIWYTKQFAPYKKTAWVMKAYEDATMLPQSYTLFDNHQDSPHATRIRSHIIPHEWPPRVYWQGKIY